MGYRCHALPQALGVREFRVSSASLKGVEKRLFCHDIFLFWQGTSELGCAYLSLLTD